MSLTSTICAACGRPLTDEVSIAYAIGPDCRNEYEYDPTVVPANVQHDVNVLLHGISNETIALVDMRAALFRLYECGFQKLAQRIDRRIGRRIARVEAEKEAAAARVAQEEAAPVKLDLPYALTEGQERARDLVARLKKTPGHALGFVVGFAGTGKTTALKVFAADHGLPTIITPTGRAALRVKEATGLYASTIHRWLYEPVEDERTGAITFRRRRPDDIVIPPSGLVLLDEASMVGPDVWKDVLATCKTVGLKLVLIGDGFQLPPVLAPGAPPFSTLTPAFAAGLNAERVEMTEVVRQARESPVIRASMALRNGGGLRAVLKELPQYSTQQLADVIRWLYANGGITICHRNVTRFSLNFSIRRTFGIYDEQPQPGEPLLVLRNNYAVGMANGESFTFEGWRNNYDGRPLVPEAYERLEDRYSGKTGTARFGGTTVGNGATKVTLALEELHGQLDPSLPARAISQAGARWARIEGYITENGEPPHVHANFGYAYTAHKCVHPNTIVETAEGLQRIRDVAPTGVVATADGPQPYRRTPLNPTGPMLRVATRDGYTVDVTPDHGLFVWNGEKYARVEAKNVTPGAFVRVSLAPRPLHENQPQVPALDEPDVRARRYQISGVLTFEMAELFGLMVADGCMTPRGRIFLAKRHADVVQRFAALWESVAGFRMAIVPYDEIKAYKAEGNSMQLVDWLRRVGGMEPDAKYVPDVVMRAPLPLQAAFLRGLFEDGTVNVKGGMLDHIEWSNKTAEVVQTVQTLLLRFGIISSRRTRSNCDGHAQTLLYIYGQNAKRFGSQVGFVSSFKNARLQLPAGRETRYGAPFSKAERESIWGMLTEAEKNNLRTTSTMSRAKMEQLSARSRPDTVSRILADKLTWHHMRIMAIERVDDAPSLCLEVPGAGRFLQNGFDFSNSQGSQWPYVLVVMEPSVRLDEEEGKRWAYTAVTRSQHMTGLHITGVMQ